MTSEFCNKECNKEIVSSLKRINRRDFIKAGGLAIFGTTAGAGAVLTEKITNKDIVPFKFTGKTYSQEKELSQPFKEEYDILPAPGYPQLIKGALEYTREGWERYLIDENKRLDILGRISEERPLAYKMILMIDNVDEYPTITISKEGYISVENGKLILDDEGNFLKARLEYLPREDNEAILLSIKIMPDGTQIPQEPNLISFFQYRYPQRIETGTAIYSTEPINVAVANSLYAIQKRFQDFAGVDFPISFYNSGDESIDIPPFIQKMAGANAILPQNVSKDTALNFVEIVGYYALANKLYDFLDSNNSRFQSETELAKYRFNDALKEFVETYSGKIPMAGLYPEGTKITEENDRVAVALGVCDITNYLNEEYKRKFSFGNIRNDPKAFFASLLTVVNFFPEKFSNAKDDEKNLGRQISGDVMKISRPVYTLLRLINSDRDAQNRLVSGIFQTGLVSYEFF